jgi:hypothetical protein
MNTDTTFEAQKRYAKKQEGAGMIRVSSWVPEAYRAEALDFMAKLRNKAIREGLVTKVGG